MGPGCMVASEITHCHRHAATSCPKPPIASLNGTSFGEKKCLRFLTSRSGKGTTGVPMTAGERERLRVIAEPPDGALAPYEVALLRSAYAAGACGRGPRSSERST